MAEELAGRRVELLAGGDVQVQQARERQIDGDDLVEQHGAYALALHGWADIKLVKRNRPAADCGECHAGDFHAVVGDEKLAEREFALLTSS